MPDNKDVSSETLRSRCQKLTKIAHEWHMEINGVQVSNKLQQYDKTSVSARSTDRQKDEYRDKLIIIDFAR